MDDVMSRPHCSVKPRTVRALPAGLPANRLELIRVMASKWVNGTVLHCSLTDGPESQHQAVRDASTSGRTCRSAWNSSKSLTEAKRRYG